MGQTALSLNSAWASLDHTFQCVSNVGLVRLADSKWVKQYSGLLCILNADGEVLSWKMTKSLSFTAMEDMLCVLRERFMRQGKTLEEFYIDNCCTLRSKLQNVFGEQLRVYLDIFHAVQRISTKIPKKHPYRHDCMRDLRLVFRDPSDQGHVRTKETPSPDILDKQLIKFQDKWKNLLHDGKYILPPTAMKEIHCLLVHIRRGSGCLSGISPGRGTSRNERLHRDINSHMKSSRYGVELAYALISGTFFNHNENIRAKKENRSALVAYSCDTPTCIEKFGLHTSTESSTLQLQPVSQLNKVKMSGLKHSEIQEALKSIDSTIPETLQDNDLEVTEDEAFSILSQAIAAYSVTKSLKSLTTTADFISSTTFFLSSFCLTQGITTCGTNTKVDDEQMDPLLASWNLVRVPSLRNGDCLFRSVAYGLIHRM